MEAIVEMKVNKLLCSREEKGEGKNGHVLKWPQYYGNT
jgi:hypothetical protein